MTLDFHNLLQALRADSTIDDARKWRLVSSYMESLEAIKLERLNMDMVLGYAGVKPSRTVRKADMKLALAEDETLRAV